MRELDNDFVWLCVCVWLNNEKCWVEREKERGRESPGRAASSPRNSLSECVSGYARGFELVQYFHNDFFSHFAHVFARKHRTAFTWVVGSCFCLCYNSVELLNFVFFIFCFVVIKVLAKRRWKQKLFLFSCLIFICWIHDVHVNVKAHRGATADRTKLNK